MSFSFSTDDFERYYDETPPMEKRWALSGFMQGIADMFWGFARKKLVSYGVGEGVREGMFEVLLMDEDGNLERRSYPIGGKR